MADVLVVAAIALVAAGRPVGLLVLSAEAAVGPDLEPLSLFANQIALAVEQAQLREQVLQTRLTEEVARLARTLVAPFPMICGPPLTRIKASSSTLADDEPDISPEAAQGLAKLIDVEADRLADLVQNLLDMSRIQAGVLQPRCQGHADHHRRGTGATGHRSRLRRRPRARGQRRAARRGFRLAGTP